MGKINTTLLSFIKWYFGVVVAVVSFPPAYICLCSKTDTFGEQERSECVQTDLEQLLFLGHQTCWWLSVNAAISSCVQFLCLAQRLVLIKRLW